MAGIEGLADGRAIVPGSPDSTDLEDHSTRLFLREGIYEDHAHAVSFERKNLKVVGGFRIREGLTDAFSIRDKATEIGGLESYYCINAGDKEVEVFVVKERG